MLDIAFIRENPDAVKENITNRGVLVDVDLLLNLDVRRRDLLKRVEELRATRNQASKTKPTDEEIARMRQVGNDILALEQELQAVQTEYQVLLSQVPNMTHPDSPVGGDNDFR